MNIRRPSIQPIQTNYKSAAFRSRLEARWAVLFDAEKIPWKYEPVGFELNGRRYLPDFWFTDHLVWVEIKPDHPYAREQRVITDLADASIYDSIIIAGNPWPSEYEVWCSSDQIQDYWEALDVDGPFRVDVYKPCMVKARELCRCSQCPWGLFCVDCTWDWWIDKDKKSISFKWNRIPIGRHLYGPEGCEPVSFNESSYLAARSMKFEKHDPWSQEKLFFNGES